MRCRTLVWPLAAASAALASACATGGQEGQGDAGDVPEAADARDTGDGADAGEASDAGCPPGWTRCGPECADLQSDPANCGACGRTCGASEVCNEGGCAGTCGAGRLRCGAECVDPATDGRNCGACGVVCPDGLNSDGACELRACILICRAGWQDGDGIPGCEVSCEGSGTPETCNGVDDDCDGAADETFACAVGRSTACTSRCGTTGSGVCTLACTPPAASVCIPPPENCNGLDEDCDGVADNGFACGPGASGGCTTGCGSSGTRACTATCEWSACVPPPEACNGVDDDCDGAVDDGFPCRSGESGSCATSCGTMGVHTCTPGCEWGACAPPAESCNGADDDCDGACDDDFECCRGASSPCTTSCGSTGSRSCGSSCRWSSCSPPVEVCNGADDDCDGACDDGFECCRGAATTTPCTTTCGSTGARACDLSCNLAGACTPPAESCNAADDDCDGTCDEGCRHGVHRSYSGSAADHFYTTDAGEASCCGYSLEALNYFYLYDSRVPGTTELWRCWSASGLDHFYTTDPACEGAAMVVEGSVGFIATSPLCGAFPLYRVYDPGGVDHFYTTSAAERDATLSGGWIDEGIAGYVWGG